MFWNCFFLTFSRYFGVTPQSHFRVASLFEFFGVLGSEGPLTRCVPPCVVKTCAERPVLPRGGRGEGGADPRIVLEGAMKQMLVEGDRLRLLDEAGGLGISSTQN